MVPAIVCVCLKQCSNPDEFVTLLFCVTADYTIVPCHERSNRLLSKSEKAINRNGLVP